MPKHIDRLDFDRLPTTNYPVSISLGCAIWSYPGWMGEVYPPKTPAKDFLRVYANCFPTVEGNTTFYAVPDEQTIARWREQTPAGFKFCPKFPKAITHNGLLEPYLVPARSFLDRMQGLGDRLGACFVQLPPNYAPTERHIEDLHSFLSQLPTTVQIALEVRHLGWFDLPQNERLNELLTSLNIGRVILDSRPIYEADPHLDRDFECKKPRVPLETAMTAPFTLVRYVSHPVLAANQQWLEAWTQQIQAWLADDRQIYFCFHCPIEARSPINARYFHELLTAAKIPIAPLPPRPADDRPTQLELF